MLEVTGKGCFNGKRKVKGRGGCHRECFDIENLYFELEGGDIEYEAEPGRVMVRIPNEIIKKILASAVEVEHATSLNMEDVFGEDWDKGE